MNRSNVKDKSKFQNQIFQNEKLCRLEGILNYIEFILNLFEIPLYFQTHLFTTIIIIDHR